MTNLNVLAVILYLYLFVCTFVSMQNKKEVIVGVFVFLICSYWVLALEGDIQRDGLRFALYQYCSLVKLSVQWYFNMYVKLHSHFSSRYQFKMEHILMQHDLFLYTNKSEQMSSNTQPLFNCLNLFGQSELVVVGVE